MGFVLLVFDIWGATGDVCFLILVWVGAFDCLCLYAFAGLDVRDVSDAGLW